MAVCDSVSPFPFHSRSSCWTYRADQVRHCRAPCCISALQKPEHTRRISHALNSQLTCAANPARNLVEEQRSYGSGVADIALLRGAARVDDADGAAGGAIGELIVGAAGVLAFGKGVGFGGEGGAQEFRDRKGFGIGGGSRGGEDAGEEGKGEDCELHLGLLGLQREGTVGLR